MLTSYPDDVIVIVFFSAVLEILYSIAVPADVVPAEVVLADVALIVRRSRSRSCILHSSASTPSVVEETLQCLAFPYQRT